MLDRKTRTINRVRAKISGTAERPRLALFRSNLHLSAQLIDDQKSITIASVSDTEIKDNKNMTDAATKIGQLMAQKAKDLKITSAVFDRRFYQYHGKVKAFVEGAREGGLKI